MAAVKAGQSWNFEFLELIDAPVRPGCKAVGGRQGAGNSAYV